MIADRRSEELCEWSKNERSPFELAVPGLLRTGPDNHS